MKKSGLLMIAACLAAVAGSAAMAADSDRPSEVVVTPEQTWRDAITGKPVASSPAPVSGENPSSAVVVLPKDAVKVEIDPKNPTGEIVEEPTARDAITGQPVTTDKALPEEEEEKSVRDRVRDKMKD